MENPYPKAEVPTWIHRLARSVKNLSEGRQRISRIVEKLAHRDSNESAQFLHVVGRRAGIPSEPFRQVHLDIIKYRDHLHTLGYERVAEIYAVAVQNNYREVSALLRTSKSILSQGELVPGGVATKLSGLTLGERRQMSRIPWRKNIDILLFDTDPRVIRELLKNPRVTHRDVVRIAARHQAPTEVMEEVCRSDRWIRLYSVRKALVFNPRTPRAYALSLLLHLRPVDVRLLLSSGSLDDEFREAARNRLTSSRDD